MIYSDDNLYIDTDRIIGMSKTDFSIMLVLDCDQTLSAKYDNAFECSKAFSKLVDLIRKSNDFNQELAF